MRLTLSKIAFTTAVALGTLASACGAPTPSASLRERPRALHSAAPLLPASVEAPRVDAICMEKTLRDAFLVAAWPEGERAYFCVEQKGEYETPVPLTCASVGPAGDYRAEAAHAKPSARFDVPKLPRESADGASIFRFQGGEREPKGARGKLIDKRTGKTLRAGAFDYDEHLAFDGWLGQGIVLSTWVDEGPGCGLLLLDPRQPWPRSFLDPEGYGLAGCFGGYRAWRTKPGTYAVLSSGGTSITFVDERTLEKQDLSTERQAGPERGTDLIPWLAGDELVVVYGAPIAGDVVRVNLQTQRITGTLTPPECAPPK